MANPLLAALATKANHRDVPASRGATCSYALSRTRIRSSYRKPGRYIVVEMGTESHAR